jgi:hypothetical protein
MNTLLLPTNTTNCTTKNLKIMAAVICMTAVFVFANISVFAQGFSNSEGKATVTKTETPAATYNNYKGIADKNEAKKAWLQDHPEENVQGVVAPEATKPAVTDKEVQSANNTTPIVSSKQIVTPQSAETIGNAVEVKAPSVENSNSGEGKQTQTMAEQRTTRSSSVAVRAEVKPYDKSTVVNEVNQNVTYPQIPGFVATGNADADAKAFEVAKTNLQQNNPAEYNKFFSGK